MKKGAPDSSNIRGAPCKTLGTIGIRVSLVKSWIGITKGTSTGSVANSSTLGLVMAPPSCSTFFEFFF